MHKNTINSSKVEDHKPFTEEYQPATRMRHALAHWDRFLAINEGYDRQAFLDQAYWLLDHQQSAGDQVGGWPISPAVSEVSPCGPYLSASIQGHGLSILVRAYQLTGDGAWLDGARRVVRSFEEDIFDGGVCAPVGSDGIFFEEVTVYPAAHSLTGCLSALLALYEYVAVANDVHIAQLIDRGLNTLHGLLCEFDSGFWTRSDLLHRRLSSEAELLLQAQLLADLANCSQCEHCSALASRWRRYPHRLLGRLRFLVTSNFTQASHAFWCRWQRKLFPRKASELVRVCVPVFGFPVMGGTRAVLTGIAKIMSDIWDFEYLTQDVGPHEDELVIHKFGTKRMAPWQFPAVWLYVLAGFCKLVSLLRRNAGYTLILPQDGVYSATFAALAARLAGIRVVCIDHGNLTLLDSLAFRKERIKVVSTKNGSFLRYLFARVRFIAYWPSLRLLAWVAARCVDHYLVPGIVGDGVEDDCQQLGIHQSRLTRFASMIDLSRHVIPDAISIARMREEKGLAADAVIIAMICRLSLEKGIEVALEGISLAIAKLPPELVKRTRIVIAGDGPLREQMAYDIAHRGLQQTCQLWGEISTADVLALLGMSDIFLYTSTRGACFSMAVLEAMASACAVIATTEPVSNKTLLSEGRGVAVSPGNAQQIGEALVCLVNNPELCQRMGQSARSYIAQKHSPAVFRRTLLRVSGWQGQRELCDH
jgi:glycosyltransferase involved in cell wall biosynthesis